MPCNKYDQEWRQLSDTVSTYLQSALYCYLPRTDCGHSLKITVVLHLDHLMDKDLFQSVVIHEFGTDFFCLT